MSLSTSSLVHSDPNSPIQDDATYPDLLKHEPKSSKTWFGGQERLLMVLTWAVAGAVSGGCGGALFGGVGFIPGIAIGAIAGGVAGILTAFGILKISSFVFNFPFFKNDNSGNRPSVQSQPHYDQYNPPSGNDADNPLPMEAGEKSDAPVGTNNDKSFEEDFAATLGRGGRGELTPVQPNQVNTAQANQALVDNDNANQPVAPVVTVNNSPVPQFKTVKIEAYISSASGTDQFAIRGSGLPNLSWDTNIDLGEGVRALGNPGYFFNYNLQVPIEANPTEFEFKIVRLSKNPDGEIEWENNVNHKDGNCKDINHKVSINSKSASEQVNLDEKFIRQDDDEDTWKISLSPRF